MRVVLVGDCPLIREGLKSILKASQDLTVVGEADKYQTIFENIQSKCDVLVMDGELEALALLRDLDRRHNKGRPPFVLILSGNNDDRLVMQMLAAGADGYLSKSKPPQFAIEAIRKVSRGMKYVSPDLAEKFLMNLEWIDKSPRLSSREYEVLCLFASGMGATQIAAHLALSVKTISTYRSRLLEKLNLNSNAQLMRYAYKEGIVT